jgi:hypothetical protein
MPIQINTEIRGDIMIETLNFNARLRKEVLQGSKAPSELTALSAQATAQLVALAAGACAPSHAVRQAAEQLAQAGGALAHAALRNESLQWIVLFEDALSDCARHGNGIALVAHVNGSISLPTEAKKLI